MLATCGLVRDVGLVDALRDVIRLICLDESEVVDAHCGSWTRERERESRAIRAP